MYCSNCGAKKEEGALFCSQCGTSFSKEEVSDVIIEEKVKSYQDQPSVDQPSMVANVASCCFPIVGLILYLVWKDNKPNSSKAVCKWAIGGTVITGVVYLLYFIFAVLVALGSSGF